MRVSSGASQQHCHGHGGSSARALRSHTLGSPHHVHLLPPTLLPRVRVSGSGRPAPHQGRRRSGSCPSMPCGRRRQSARRDAPPWRSSTVIFSSCFGFRARRVREQVHVERLHNGTGQNLDTSHCPHLIRAAPGSRPRRLQGLQGRGGCSLAQRSISSVSGAPAGAPACRCRWVAWMSRAMQQRRSAQTGAARLSARAHVVGTIGFVVGRDTHLRVPAGHRVEATAAERADHLGALAACDGTHTPLD